MGLTAVPHRFGFFRATEAAPQWGWVTVTDVDAAGVPTLVEDIRAHYGDAAVSIDVDDATYSPAVGAALIEAGWTRFHATVYLAHVGELPAPVDGVEVERVDASTIDEFSRVKLMGFADSEDEPEQQRIAEDSAVRLSEMRANGRCLWARIEGDPAAICAYYDGDDYLVFLLATRVPYRRRGLGRTLLHHVLAEGRGARSVIINAEEGGRPEALYRSLGFTDVLYRRWAFRQPDAP